MKKLLFLFALSMSVMFSSNAFATEQSKATMQTEFGTYKLQQFNAESNYDRLINLSDSVMFSGEAFSTDPALNCPLRFHNVDLTEAEINAGHIIFASASGKNVFVKDVQLYSSGTTNEWTSVVFENTLGTDIVSFTSAGTQNGAFSSLDDSYATISVGIVDGTGSGSGLKVIKTGTDGAGSSTLRANIAYCLK